MNALFYQLSKILWHKDINNHEFSKCWFQQSVIFPYMPISGHHQITVFKTLFMYLPKHLDKQTPSNSLQNDVSTNYVFSKYTIWIFYWYWTLKHLDTYIFFANILSYKWGKKKKQTNKKYAFEIKHCFCVRLWVFNYYFQTTRGHSTAILLNFLDSVITTWLMHEILRWEGHLHPLVFESEIMITDLGNMQVKISRSNIMNINRLFTKVTSSSFK